MEKLDKKARLQTIRKIVSTNSLESQEDLLAALKEEGFVSTQTTLSRDLKQLRISKVRIRNGHSVYALPREGQFEPVPSLEEVNQTKWRLNFSGNLMVVHTPPGHASMVAYDVDNAKNPNFLGTVAGDNCMFACLREGVSGEQFMATLKKHIPEIED